MKTDQPTKPGAHYWRESDGGEWRVADVFGCSANYFASIGLRTRRKKDFGGQWLRIPDVDELVELQRKAKAYDEGQTMIEVAYNGVTMDRFIHPENKEILEHYGSCAGYTCEPVTIVRKEKP